MADLRAAARVLSSGEGMAGTLTCKEFVDFLGAYLAGELPPADRDAFNEHLSLCPSCVSYLKSYRAAIRLGKVALAASEDEVPPEVPDALVNAILASREGSASSPRRRNPRRRPASNPARAGVAKAGSLPRKDQRG